MMKRAEELIKEYDAIVSAGRDDETEQWIRAACAEYEREYPDDIAGRCALYNEAGSFYRHRNRAGESIDWFLRAKELMETETNRTVNYANTINNLAGAYRLTGQFEEAKDFFQKAIEIYEQNPNLPKTFLCSGYNNLALVELDCAHEKEALNWFGKALSVLEKTQNNYYEKATTYANMAVAYFRMGRREEVVDCLQKADEYYIAGGLEGSMEYQAFSNLQKMIKSRE